jgi:hypothetical protein
MALPFERLPHLRLIDGRGTAVSRIEEAHVEAIAFTHEVELAAVLIVDQITGLPVPSVAAIDAANRIAHRARLARAELVALGPKDAA